MSRPSQVGDMILRTKSLLAAAAAFSCLLASTAGAAVVMDFTGVNTGSNPATPIGGFYDGGVSGDGASGPNLGAEFGGNAIVVNDYNGCCEPDSKEGKKGVMTIAPNQFGDRITFMNFAAGFDHAFAFDYSAYCATFVEITSGLDGTGDILAHVQLFPDTIPAICGPDATGFYCNWLSTSVSFQGTAHSVFLALGGNGGFDRLTLGSTVAGGLPEPGSWVLMIGGFGLAGATLRRRRALAA